MKRKQMEYLTACLLLVFAGYTARAAPTTTVLSAKLVPVEAFDLQQETQRRALRGIMGAGVNQNKLAGKNLAGVVAAALTLAGDGKIPPYYGTSLSLDPGAPGFRAINPAWIEPNNTPR